MPTNFINRSPEMVGVYLTDGATVAPSQKGQNYWLPETSRFLPILNMLQFTERAELRLADTAQSSNDIETYNAKTNNYSLNQSLITRNRLDVSAGDLLVGGVRLVLNFMESPVSVKTRSDIPKLFRPLVNSQLEDYKGKLVVLSFHSFNTPTMIRDLTGIANYFENLRLDKIQRGEVNTTPVKMLEYLSRCWQEFKPETAKCAPSNSIKLAMVHIYNPSDFMREGISHEDLYCSESGLLIRRTDNIFEMGIHPKLSDSMVANKQIVQSLRDNGMSCFIVDNDKRVSARFINFAGQIRQIPQVVDKHRPQGLYITSIDGDKSLEADSFVPLDKIDESPYIFRSQEEARLGADIRTQTAQTHELTKLELGIEATHLRHDYEERIRQMDLDAKRRQAEFDASAKKMDAQYQEALRAIQLSMEDRKDRSHHDKYRFEVLGMENKHRYESEKYERDTTVETLKTIGSVAGLMAGGYVLYKQLSKS
jgi:hypothetical protein